MREKIEFYKGNKGDSVLLGPFSSRQVNNIEGKTGDFLVRDSKEVSWWVAEFDEDGCETDGQWLP